MDLLGNRCTCLSHNHYSVLQVDIVDMVIFDPEVVH